MIELNGNFCNETQVSKVTAEVEVDARAVPFKMSTGFSCMSVTANCCVFWCFCTNMLMGAFAYAL